jgi:hypothetical protein
LAPLDDVVDFHDPKYVDHLVLSTGNQETAEMGQKYLMKKSDEKLERLDSTFEMYQ